ncbi:hypothetical protein HYT51_02555 [Candidatus Woesearchaeota archaeon]|nr:hypothetical protein [Candidatus Woesearchaeota archaeon]
MAKRTISLTEPFIEISKKRRQIDIEIGDLVLVYTKRGEQRDPALGVFAELVDGYFCFAEQPYRLELLTLQSRIEVPYFRPLNAAQDQRARTRRINGWKYNLLISLIADIIPEKEAIIERLRTVRKYDGHIETIKKMKKPYVNNEEVRKRLEL